jgi:hypothetical protein
VFDPAALPVVQTVNVPGPVNTCDLKLPQDDVKIVPPVAVIYAAVGASLCKPESVTNQPCVESIKTNVTAIPSVLNVTLTAEPPILSEPF